MTVSNNNQYKYQHLKDYLIANVRSGKYGSNGKVDSEPALSKQFKLSRNTVRQAIKELESEGYFYRIQGKGTFVRDASPNISRKIALLIYDTAYMMHPITAELIRGIDHGLSQHDYALDILASQRTYQHEQISRLSESYAGLLIGAWQIDEMILNEIKKSSIPSLFVKNYPNDFREKALRIDFEKAGLLAAGHLINQGRKNLALITAGDEIAISFDFKKGVQQVCLEHGARLKAENIFISNYGDTEMPLKIAQFILRQTELPDGVICSTDEQAIALCKELHKHHIKVPDQIAVTGCNNAESSASFSPSITTLELPMRELGKYAADMILKLICGKNIEPVIMEPNLIIRESTRIN